jgi:phage replication-related protein YjqB (UPF0714/DUF867 family)
MLVLGLLVIAAAGQSRELDCGSALNIVNRNLTGEGVRLELSEPLRDTMFTENTRPRHKHTTTQVLWTFVAVCCDVIYWFEVDRSFCSR